MKMCGKRYKKVSKDRYKVPSIVRSSKKGAKGKLKKVAG